MGDVPIMTLPLLGLSTGKGVLLHCKEEPPNNPFVCSGTCLPLRMKHIALLRTGEGHTDIPCQSMG